MQHNPERCQAGKCLAYRFPDLPYCRKHWRRWDRHGDPNGSSARTGALKVHLRTAARAIKSFPDRAAIDTALKSAEALLKYTARYTASARQVSASVAFLRPKAVTPLQLLTRVTAWRLFTADNEHKLPRGVAPNRIGLGRYVLMMARTRRKAIPGVRRPKPLTGLSTVQLRTFGAALQVTFRGLPVRIEEHLNRAHAT